MRQGYLVAQWLPMLRAQPGSRSDVKVRAVHDVELRTLRFGYELEQLEGLKLQLLHSRAGSHEAVFVQPLALGLLGALFQGGETIVRLSRGDVLELQLHSASLWHVEARPAVSCFLRAQALPFEAMP